jgi:hypothetical protein
MKKQREPTAAEKKAIKELNAFYVAKFRKATQVMNEIAVQELGSKVKHNTKRNKK